MIAALVVVGTYVLTFFAGAYSRFSVNLIRKHGGYVDPRDFPNVQSIERVVQHSLGPCWRVRSTKPPACIYAVDLEVAMKSSLKKRKSE
jgi:hypothetical protein